ncbi:hypothetical protein DPMN_011658, partial [Dreissena polymorpha]
MSSYTEHLDEEDEGDLNPSSSEMQRLMNEKAHELFQVCDTEKKGFITKRDMQRLQSELPLSPEQLEHVFDSLDVDGNGFLSLEEFTDGFGGFLGLRSTSDGAMDNDATYMDESGVDPHEEEQNFHTMMEHLGVTNIVEGDSTVKSLWCRLRKDDTGMASTFEDFLFRVSNEIRKSKCEFDSLEDALKSKTNAHDEEVRKLYEEMEVQIKQEKEKILAEERSKERQLREAMEQEIMEKDKQLQEIVSRHSEMEEKLGFLNTVEAETKIEKEKLAKEKEDLEESFHRSQQALAECQAYINQLRQQQKEDKRERAKAALKLSEGIALERETLVNQLEKLKTMNRQLQDEKDEAVLRRGTSYADDDETKQSDDNARSERAVPRRAELERQGSSLGKYFDTNRAPKSSRTESIKEDIAEEAIGSNFDEEFEDEDVECDDEVYMIANQTPSFIHHTVKDNYSPGKQPLHSSPIVRQHGDNSRVADFDEDSRVVDSRNAGTKNYDANPNDFNVEREWSGPALETIATSGTASQQFSALSKSPNMRRLTSNDVTMVTCDSTSFPEGKEHHRPSTRSMKGEEVTRTSNDLLFCSDTREAASGSQVKHRTSEMVATDTEYSPKGILKRSSYIADDVYTPNKELKDSKFSVSQSLTPDSVTTATAIDSSKGSQSPTLTLKKLTPEERIRAVNPHFDRVAFTAAAITNFAAYKPSESDLHTPDSPRTQPVGADELTDSGIQSTVETTALQRIFKVVFVGDSGVGKSSFIHRFCTDNFRPSFSATIGVDFQIKSLPIEGQLIVLQLWDTAGQERFRSITKQYFRKADGVVIMYDVNSEVTFTNVRNWMISVKEGASEDAVLLLLGNKCDMAEDDYCKVVKMKCGSHLAD